MEAMGRSTMQAKRFGTFVVRYWWLADGEQRLAIEHVQSGKHHHCTSLRDAEAWIAARVNVPTGGSDGIQAWTGEAISHNE